MSQTAPALVVRPRDRSGSPPGMSEFAPLLRAVKGQELLERRYGWYARVITANAFALAGVVTGIVLLGDSWMSLLLAPPLAVFWRPH